MPEVKWREGRFLRVPLTDEEVRQRGELLAKACGDLKDIKNDHKVKKEEMKAELEAAEGEITTLVKQVTERAETRHVEIEVRVNTTLALVEEVRLDTGEVIRQRDATPDDRMRAQELAQEDFFSERPDQGKDGAPDQN